MAARIGFGFGGQWVGSAVLLVASTTVVLGLTEALVRSRVITSSFVPAPSAVLISLPEAASQSLGPLELTIGEVAISFALAMALGVGLGLLMGGSLYANSVAGGYAFILNSTPKVIFLPLLILWFGLGLKAVVVFGVLEASLPVSLLVAGAVRDLDRDALRIAVSMGATRSQLQLKVVFPASAPAILASAQVGFVFCVTGVVLAQMFFGVGGIGALLLNDAYNLQIARLYAVALLLAILVSGVFWSTRYVTNHYAAKWHARISAPV
jgi:ABC-type nitrate/sulfonate/bicarbonate transport system permease component